nr:hypothetical protein [Desertifilum tharense]
MIERIYHSLSYRAVYNYCLFLKSVKTRYTPKISWQPIDLSLPRFVSIVYDADVPLLVRSLHHLMKWTDKSPQLWLVGDSDAAYVKLQSSLGNSLPNGVELWHWQTLLQTLDISYQNFIKTWEASGKWGGYSRRFAVTLAANSCADIIMFDADVLWYGNFPSSLQKLTQKESNILAGKDYDRAYDLEVASFLGNPKILENEPLNCGIVYYPKSILLNVVTPELVMKLLPYAARATNHLEQTLVAYAFWQSRGQWFDSKIVATTMVDRLSFQNQVQSLARHYAGAKHLFWRDA